jgi:hypothetical protein
VSAVLCLTPVAEAGDSQPRHGYGRVRDSGAPTGEDMSELRAAGRQRSGDIRTWAKEHGLAVSERGRIPASVVEQYNAAGGR